MLEGIKVVEYATYIAAPGCGGMMADWGADVVKVEPPGGDPIRKFFDSIGAESAQNPVFDMDNRGKRSIILDTAAPEGKAVLQKLAAEADVFLTNVRPAGLARAGLDYENLKLLNPRLVYASVTGYGLEGPDIDRPGFDVSAFWARSGMATLMAPKGVDPFVIRTGMGDHITSMATCAGVLAALVERGRTGKGRLVEASLLRAANYALSSDMAITHAFGKIASTRPRPQSVQPLANFFQSGDGKWFVLVPRQGEADWAPICRALGLDHLITDERFTRSRARRENGPALVALIDEAFSKWTFEEIAKRLDAESLAWAPAQTAVDAARDPQLIAAGGVVDIPQADGGTKKAPGSPLRFPGTDDGPKGPAPRPGEHTRSVLAQAGFSSDEIEKMIASGAAREGL
ncbi:MAG: CoA transferase [Hyphomonadaceae bacterium]|nr:MAG: fidA [Caulobacteraceae bacterium]MBT9447517.1 CoA transferase [Hyphomonadaceae bacterium]TPW07899.1 MAG: fidA [Alphaproteobacteria bacterium]